VRRSVGLGAAALAALAVSAAAWAERAAPLPQRQGGWVAAADPVLRAGDLRERGLWNDPSVLKVDGRYVMYLTTSVDRPFRPPVLPFRAVSADGLNWRLEPQTPLIQAAGTAFVSIETPSVVRFRGRYHMFFTGVFARAEPAPMAIGHAVSDDGVRWRVSPQPVIAATGRIGDWNGYLVGEPGAVVLGDEMLVYFSAVGARPDGFPPQVQTIGLARTSDGERFSAPVRVLSQSALYPPSAGFAGYSTPAALLLNGKVHLFYDVALYRRDGDPDWQQVALHHAVSADGEHGFVQDSRPIFTRDDFRWTSGEILAPSPLVDRGAVRMWFAGHVRRDQLGPLIGRGVAGPEFGIGHASRPVAGFE
jgi:hypothetical protein